MNTVLIAEDEKLLREGLRAMIGRCGVPIGEILEAHDGLEALEILHTVRVDLLITDIRMPNMDGIELVTHLAELDDAPAVLVVSGYDDFSYAVEMLRNGVSDYLLKPVERDRLYTAVRKAEERYRACASAKEEKQKEDLEVLRRLMLETDVESENWKERVQRYEGSFFTGGYVGFCCARTPDRLPDGVLQIHAAGAVMFYAAAVENVGELEHCLALPAGKSGMHQGLEELAVCYREAYGAWRLSYFTGELCTPRGEVAPSQGVTARQLVGMVGLSKWQEAVQLLWNEADRVSCGEASPEDFANLCEQFAVQMNGTYREFLGEETDILRYKDIWDFGCADRYLEALCGWLENFCTKTAAAFSDYENRQKIQQAVQYVQEHFREQLSMTEVSNRVSMNYSLFSTLFKQYTGVNFVNYLQNLRVEEAKRLLDTTVWRVYEIGRHVGFADDKHFLKIFKAVTGFSPTEYRKTRLLTRQRDEKKEEI